MQAASFKERKGAHRLLEKLKGSFERVYVETAQVEQGTRFRVRIGPLPSQQVAQEVRTRLNSHGIGDALIESIDAPTGQQQR